MEKILDIRDLTIHFEMKSGVVEAVNHVSFTLNKGETLGLVGETGAGKTTTALGIMNLVQTPPGRIVSGEILFEDRDLRKLSTHEMRKVRGNDISMIEAAGIGIAMYNASDDVKAAATMVTALDNNHDGLARELLDLV